jgi:hypothetical protein
VNINWRPFIENDCVNQFSEKNDSDLFQFTNEEQEEYANLIQQTGIESNAKSLLSIDEEEEINIDDI